MKIKEMFKKIIVGIFPFIATISSKAFAIVDIDGGWPPYPYYNTNSTTQNTIFNNQLVSVVLGLCQFILLYIIFFFQYYIKKKKRNNFLFLLYYYPFIWFITSSAKFSSFFSIPSPTSKRTILTIEPFLDLTKAPTVISESLTKSCSSKQISL